MSKGKREGSKLARDQHKTPRVKRTSSSSPKRGRGADTSNAATALNADGTPSSMGLGRKRKAYPNVIE